MTMNKHIIYICLKCFAKTNRCCIPVNMLFATAPHGAYANPDEFLSNGSQLELTVFFRSPCS